MFRYKKYGWHGGNTYVIFESGKEIEIPDFTNAFLNNLICRPSCHDCRFCYTERYSDFTIGDFWGIEKVDSSVRDDNTGISLLNVNTEKGKDIFKKIRSQMIVKKVNTKIAFENNHHSNTCCHPKRELFFTQLSEGIINENNIIYYLKKYVKVPLYRRVIRKIKSIIKKILRKSK